MKIDSQQEKSKPESNDEKQHRQAGRVDSGPNLLKSPIATYEHDLNDEANLCTELLKCFRDYSDRTLLIDAQSNTQWTGERLLQATGRLACKLGQGLRLGPGNTILLLCEHYDREVVMALSCFIAGCAICPQNPIDGLEEIKTICSMVPDISLIATQSKHHALAFQLRNILQKSRPTRIPIIYIDEGAKNDDQIISMDDVIRDGHLDTEFLQHVGRESIEARKCPSYYMLTSGSTGYPKVVDNSQWGLISNARSMFYSTQSIWNASIPEERLLPLNEESILAGDLPMDHGAGIGFLIMTIMLGARQIILPVDDVDKLCHAIGKYKINFLINGSTKIFKFMKKVKEDALQNQQIEYDLSSLRHISNVGAKVNFVQLIRDVEQLLPELKVTQSYGCTEVGHVATLPFSESRKDLQSVGWLYPGVLGIVVDSDGQQLGPNERGELHLWSDSLFARYICRQEIDAEQATADSFDSKGYYKTGDLVHYDELGRLFIHGRIKETLQLAGEWKILPAELEAVVNEHPLIEFSAIVGVPDREIPGVDAVRAFVKLIGTKSAKYLQLTELSKREDLEGGASAASDLKKLLNAFEERDHEFIARDIYDFSAMRTAPEKHLRGGVRILEDFPKNGRLQKIDRKALKLMD